VVSTGVALHLMPHLLQRGLTPAGAVGAVSLGFIASALGTFGWGYAADRLSAYAPLLATYLLRAGSLLLLLLADSLPEAYGFAVLQGLAEGGMSVLLPLLLAEYYGRQHLGALYGVLRAVQVAGFAVGPLIAGAAFDLTHRYDAAFVLFVLCGVLGAALMAGARRTEVPRPA
jgi:MFS family permease